MPFHGGSRTLLSQGSFRIHLCLDPDGRLLRVQLPPTPPTSACPSDFLELLLKLQELPILQTGRSTFQNQVWQRISQIRLGLTDTYSGIAAKIGCPSAQRAVGSACGRNPLLLRIPCHRVIAQRGPGGYAAGLEWKTFLLRIEKHFRQSNIAHSLPPSLNRELPPRPGTAVAGKPEGTPPEHRPIHERGI